MVTPAQRATHSKEFAWLTLAGIPAFVFCGLAHICMDGHMEHLPYPWWHFALDLQWVVFFGAAAIRVRQSDISRARLASWLLIFCVVFRFLLGSLGGGLLVLYDLPVIIYLGVVALRSLWRLKHGSSMLGPDAHTTT